MESVHNSKQPLSLVSGCAGFVGSHLVDRLIQKGHNVIGIDNLSTGSCENLCHALEQPELFRFIQGDLSDTTVIPDQAYDFIWHIASPASPPDYQRLSIDTMLINSLGTKNMLDMAKKKGSRFLLTSTSEVYGDPSMHPQKESYWGNVNPVGERACYDESKRFAEALTMEYHRKYAVETRIVRIFNTYGPRMRPNDGRVITNFIVQALEEKPLTIYGDGTQTRSFQYIDDLIDGLLLVMESDYAHPINLGNPEEYSMLELARIVLELTGSTSHLSFLPLPSDDPKQRKPDITLAKQLLSWEPKVTLRQGLMNILTTFQALKEI
ncbi:NAD-dependent epimerase/dehydratase family protein [Heliobacillus mobilis]|uniref:NAD-dependent epimerase/dehydratase family protein n=1 Tax=Heliobacterium mobile TaxID=28064 RepID=A0A6I3SN05_HELMO|nr:UDP-glucuronic acid decarboxylase family protein [Heliobacterium mobile]MTV50380.1 NAD-dependent epimerase/dehydratase family protein [Heliobacterium mobile]